MKSSTAGYFGAFVTVGLATAVLGPTLLRLAEGTGSQLGQAGFLVTAMSLGYLLGSLLSGRLYDRTPDSPVGEREFARPHPGPLPQGGGGVCPPSLGGGAGGGGKRRSAYGFWPDIILDFGQNKDDDQKPVFLGRLISSLSQKSHDSSRNFGVSRQKTGF